jgi:hypothetical protein
MRKWLGKINGLQEEEEGQGQNKRMGSCEIKKTLRIGKHIFSLTALYSDCLSITNLYR